MTRARNIRCAFGVYLAVILLSVGKMAFGAGLLGEDISTVNENNNTAFSEMDVGPLIVLMFESGSSKVSADQEAELKAFLVSSRFHFKIREVIVAAYSDKPFPAESGTSLTSEDRDLAIHRGYMVQRKLEEFGASNVHVVNMAKRPNWFDTTFMTRNGQIKKMLGSESFDPEVDNPFYRSVASKMHTDAGPGAVVIAVRIGATN